MPSTIFALVDNHRAWLGIGLQRIITSWLELERWFYGNTAARQIAIGYIRYDQTVYFGIFQKLQSILLRQLTDASPFWIEPLRGESLNVYAEKIAKLKRHLAIGDIYQANYCYRFSAHTNATANQLLYWFTQKQPTPYGALISTPTVQVISNSPELGLRITGSVIETRPMKGTQPRKKNMYRALLTSAKDKAELDMITDVARNDLAQFAVPGSVSVKRRRQIVGYNTIWQAQSIIQARRPKHIDSLAVIQAMIPFASVTGAPKLRAVKILKNLETHPRGLYCGAIGYIAGKNKAEFNVAIRTATLQHGQLQYYVGGGITLDSDINQEYQETVDKAAILLACQ
ncbi:MAG: anthranilate synthase component I family protein [Candidatus Kerfeldbacteria bacterium]|nr:anthranilate synthase component I family protein [Candidatus Kerfeldbacteria bacterium]